MEQVIEPDKKEKQVEEKPLSVYQTLLGRYPANEYILMEEVCSDAGHGANSRADYIAANFWPSRGLSITGIELKKSRNDWQNELKNPSKADTIFKFCDYWYLLTTNDKIASIDEIPELWGWLVITGRGIKVMKPAPKLQPTEITRGFMFAMLKRAADKKGWTRCDEEYIEKLVESRIGYKGNQLERIGKEYSELQEQVQKFEKFAGIKLNERYSYLDWKAEEKGKLFNIIYKGNIDIYQNKLIKLVEDAKDTLEKLTQAANIMKTKIENETGTQD